MSEKIAISTEDQEKLAREGCHFERSTATKEQIAIACKTDLKDLSAKLATIGVSDALLTRLKADVQTEWGSGTWDTPVDGAKWDGKKVEKKVEPNTPPPLAQNDPKLKWNPDTLTAPPQSFRDIMYAIKWGFLPVTIAEPKYFKDGKLGSIQRWVQWIYVWPSRAAAWLQATLRSIGDGNYKSLIAEEMRTLSEWLEELKKKWATARKTGIETSITELGHVKTQLDLGTPDGDKQALKHFDEYMKHTGIVKVHGLDHTSAWTEAARLRTELSAIDTAILTERQKIEARDKALKVFIEWSTAITPAAHGVPAIPITIPRAELDRTYTEAIEDIKQWRKSTALSASFSVPQIAWVDVSMSEMTAHHDQLITDAKKIAGAIPIAAVWWMPAISISDITEAKINAQIARLERDPAFTTGAPRVETVPGAPWSPATTISHPASPEYTGTKAQIAALETHRSTIEWQGTGAENAKRTALKVYTDEITRLEKAKWVDIRARDTLKATLEREKVAAENEKVKKTTEYTDKQVKYTERLAKLDAIARVTGTTPADIAKRTALSADYDRVAALTETIGHATWGADATRRATVWDASKNRTEKNAAIDSRIWELRHGKEKVYDARGSAERMTSYEGKIAALQSQAADLARDIDAGAKKSWDAETYKRQLFEEVGRINGEVEKLNKLGQTEVTGWEKLPQVELDKLLAGSKLGNHIYGVSHGLIKLDEKMLNQKYMTGTMRGMYGIVGLAGIGALGMQATQDIKSTAWDVADVAWGFVPGYDLYMALVRGKDLNNRSIEWKDFWARVGFGTLALVPWVGALARTAGIAAVKAAGKADKAIDVVSTVRAVEQSTQVVGKIGTAGYLGYTIYDISKQVITEPIKTVLRQPINK